MHTDHQHGRQHHVAQDDVYDIAAYPSHVTAFVTAKSTSAHMLGYATESNSL